jgi:hypothetical protein
MLRQRHLHRDADEGARLAPRAVDHCQRIRFDLQQIGLCRGGEVALDSDWDLTRPIG